MDVGEVILLYYKGVVLYESIHKKENTTLHNKNTTNYIISREQGWQKKPFLGSWIPCHNGFFCHNQDSKAATMKISKFNHQNIKENKLRALKIMVK